MKAAKKVELLAPAGNAEAFYGAIHAGADAIYPVSYTHLDVNTRQGCNR